MSVAPEIMEVRYARYTISRKAVYRHGTVILSWGFPTAQRKGTAKNLLVAAIHKQKQMLRSAQHDRVAACLTSPVFTCQEFALGRVNTK